MLNVTRDSTMCLNLVGNIFWETGIQNLSFSFLLFMNLNSKTCETIKMYKTVIILTILCGALGAEGNTGTNIRKSLVGNVAEGLKVKAVP